MRTYSSAHHLDGHEVATYKPNSTLDEIVVHSPTNADEARLVLPHRLPAPLRLAFLRSLAHAAEELAEQIELQAAREYADKVANPTGTEYDLSDGGVWGNRVHLSTYVPDAHDLSEASDE